MGRTRGSARDRRDDRRARRPDGRTRAAARRLRRQLRAATAPRRARASDRSFEPAGRFARDRARRSNSARVRVPAGVELDLGASAKAFAADRIARAAARSRGVACSSRSAATSPSRARPPKAAGRCASPSTTPPGSTRTVRWSRSERAGSPPPAPACARWRTAAGELHHILDPRSGAPAQTPWATRERRGGELPRGERGRDRGDRARRAGARLARRALAARTSVLAGRLGRPRRRLAGTERPRDRDRRLLPEPALVPHPRLGHRHAAPPDRVDLPRRRERRRLARPLAAALRRRRAPPQPDAARRRLPRDPRRDDGRRQLHADRYQGRLRPVRRELPADLARPRGARLRSRCSRSCSRA